MGQATRTTKLVLDLGERGQGGANTGKRTYLTETVALLTAARAFYIDFFLTHADKLAGLIQGGENTLSRFVRKSRQLLIPHAIIVRMNQHDSNDIHELHAWVSGWVQGVGFRDFVIRKALSLGLRGYTRNDSSGDVEVLAQGKRAALEQLLSLLRRGPSAAQISDVRVQWGQPTEYFSGFHIRW